MKQKGQVAILIDESAWEMIQIESPTRSPAAIWDSIKPNETMTIISEKLDLGWEPSRKSRN